MAYITPADFVLRYDVRQVCQYVSDTGQPVTPTSLATNPVLLAILEDASQMIVMAARKGQRYTLAQLNQIYNSNTTVQDPNGINARNQLISLCANLAWGLLVSRRGFSVEQITAMAPMYRAALETVQMIADGQRIFDDEYALVAEAGVSLSQVTGRQLAVAPWSTQISRNFPECGGAGGWYGGGGG